MSSLHPALAIIGGKLYSTFQYIGDYDHADDAMSIPFFICSEIIGGELCI